MRGGGGKISSDDNSFRLLFFSGNRRVVSVRFVCSQPQGGFPVWRRLFFEGEIRCCLEDEERKYPPQNGYLVDPF